MEKILFVCINYKNEDEVKEYIKNIEFLNINCEIIIVNNLENKNLREILKEIKIKYRIYEPNTNLGYLNGLFFGINEYLKTEKALPRWIVFSNTDIQIKELPILKNEYSNDIWCIAPNIYSLATNSYQNPHYKTKISKYKIKRLIFINSIPILSYIYTKLSEVKARIKKKKEEKNQYVYAAHGAFFILNREFLKSFKLNYGAFLYSEEAFIAEKIFQAKKKIYYDNSLKIIHLEHTTTNLLSVGKKSKYIKESLKYILKEFYEKN